MKRIPSASLSTATVLCVALSTSAARADTVVQVPLPGLLDGRSVTTLTGGNIVVWTVPTDGGGLQNAFATAAVAMLKGAPVANALPDDGRFPADTRHPEVVLHFSNAADAASPQTHLVKPSVSFSFAMPAATYSKLFLFFNGAAGGTTVKVTLTYADATTEIQNATVPDYYADISPTDPVIFNLATNLAKWSKTTTIAEANHHNITGVELHPMAAKALTGIQVDRGANGYLLFWGATGIATSAVAGLPDGGGDASIPEGGDAAPIEAGGGTGGAAAGGASGAGGAGGPSGAGGSGGESGGGAAGAMLTSGSAGSSGVDGSAASDSGGCGCRMGAADGAPRKPGLWLLLGALGTWYLGQRRQPKRRRSR
jgi:hypothetical protein